MLRTALLASLVTLSMTSAFGCGSSSDAPDNDAFDTYQDCWTEHHTTEGFTAEKAVEICCIDHPIGSAAMNTVCGDTAASCETYVDANLGSGDATSDDITNACTAYVTDRAG